jgi:hypothetical protein
MAAGCAILYLANRVTTIAIVAKQILKQLFA